MIVINDDAPLLPPLNAIASVVPTPVVVCNVSWFPVVPEPPIMVGVVICVAVGDPSTPLYVMEPPDALTALASAVATPVPKPVMLPIAGVHVVADAAVMSPLPFVVKLTH